MKYNIVFSIPVHEKYEVVIDLLLNVLHFNPGCAIVLHYAHGFRQANSAISFTDFERIIKEIGNVYINPETVRTGAFDLIQAHISNFKYIVSIVDFTYFALTASNELFIKRGLYEHIQPYDCGVSFIDIDSDKKWIISDMAKQDDNLSSYLNSQGWSKIMGSHVEGSFYKKCIMSEIIRHIDLFFDYKVKGVIYPREEVFYPTFLWNISQEKALNILNPGLYCWTPWNKTFYQWDIMVRDVKRLRKKNANVFSVKRIPRVIDNYVRDYVRRNEEYCITEQSFIRIPIIPNSWSFYFIQDLKQNVVASYKGYSYRLRNYLKCFSFFRAINSYRRKILTKI